MTKNLAKFDLKSSFLSCEKDTDTILRKLFIESRPYSDMLKRLLVISTKDCLDNETSELYKKKIQEASVKKLIDDGYIQLFPKLRLPENEEVKSYIFITFDNFIPNSTNPEYRDCALHIDVISHTDYWDIGNFRQRPVKICGYIDAILNNARLSGIGLLEFAGAQQFVLNDDFSGYSLLYRAVHGSDDKIPPEEDEE